MESLILGADGKPAESQKTLPCPKCGRGPDKRVQSGGFGETWLVCHCGYEFNKELKCPSVIV